MKLRGRVLLASVSVLLALILFTYTVQAETIRQVTMDEIQKDMAKGSSDEILKEGHGIVLIKYDEKGEWKKTYFKEVFQEEETFRKPVLVLFHDIDKEGAAYNLRGSIIFKELNNKYKGWVKFIAVKLPWNETNSEYHKMTLEAKSYHGRGLGIFSTPEGKRSKQLPPVKGAPSIVMYAPWDILEGETPSKNDMNIKLLDISLGAPYNDADIPVWLYVGDDSIINWVKYNIFTNPGYTYREANKASSFNRIMIPSTKEQTDDK